MQIETFSRCNRNLFQTRYRSLNASFVCPFRQIAEEEVLGFTICCYFNGPTDRHGPRHSSPDKSNQEQCLPSSIFIANTALSEEEEEEKKNGEVFPAE